jgi:predicted transcriptional regulator
MKAMTNETRRKIFLLLQQKDSISYSQIQSSFQIRKGTLNHHLHVLVSSGLIRNFSIETPGNPYSSYYGITNFGRRFIEGLHETLEPKTQNISINIASTTYANKFILGSASEGEEELQSSIATAEIPAGR